MLSSPLVNPSERVNPPNFLKDSLSREVLVFAILIIIGIGCAQAAGIGIGAHQGLAMGAVKNLNQIQISALIGFSESSALLFLITGIVGLATANLKIKGEEALRSAKEIDESRLIVKKPECKVIRRVKNDDNKSHFRAIGWYLMHLGNCFDVRQKLRTKLEGLKNSELDKHIDPMLKFLGQSEEIMNDEEKSNAIVICLEEILRVHSPSEAEDDYSGVMKILSKALGIKIEVFCAEETETFTPKDDEGEEDELVVHTPIRLIKMDNQFHIIC